MYFSGPVLLLIETCQRYLDELRSNRRSYAAYTQNIGLQLPNT